ncbi:hypothetical protein N7539_007496 [Penicillium diatomitis]|uniref:Uncharacterized protein n=1 Tax=Penicillium diatomitis TaxID=2819901 RepID=A0A9X0BP77_9EURO|nr:uncharacterized protein N7539_007496 [Penicillium diatomitis]KAJ5477352.1 hypothetical protein N7539_007496 [Penicillium diatomitis]
MQTQRSAPTFDRRLNRGTPPHTSIFRSMEPSWVIDEAAWTGLAGSQHRTDQAAIPGEEWPSEPFKDRATRAQYSTDGRPQH